MSKLFNVINLLNNKFDIIKPLIVYLLLSAILFNFFKYSALQDLISYLSISQKYYNGDFSNAINGVWGPLLSWLMIPLNYINLNPIISFKFLQILIGALTILSITKFLDFFGFQKVLKNYLILSSILIIEYYVYLTGTPDLLFACIVIYLILLFLKWDLNKIKFSIYSGLLGVLLYFAKPFGFPYFIILFVLFNVLFYWLINKKVNIVNLRNTFIGLFVFGILSLPWIYLISIKYERVTFSTGGEYNFAIVGPQYESKHIPRIEKLYKPVNNTAASYWEDPTFLIAEKWNPFSSIDNFLHLTKIVFQNTVQSIFLFLKFSPLLLLFLFLESPKKVFGEPRIKLIVFVGLVYMSGIVLLFIDQRFLIHLRIILLVITGVYAASILNKLKLNTLFKTLALIFLMISLSAQPIYSLIKHLNYGKDIFRIADITQKSYDIHGNIASISANPLDEDWGSTLTISYLLNSKYFGEVDSKLDQNAIYTELKKYKVSYLFVWDLELDFKHQCFIKIFNNNLFLYDSFLGYKNKKKLTIFKII